ncbi:virion structural protein [Pseudomonas phage Phabio]|uniref:Virion structural protein n=1 Tax=Pseudomonas phage Phabio TaxID=2006668 RepID=A0A1Y0STR1_9CAUD|nr:virion structural protein [Pseudomonas phage Phabio]ARV76862.1 virion structural protein [Pseudomonas phage Phabio]
MYNLKGFYEYLPLVNNSPDQVAVLGEISGNSLTYAKDKTVHIGPSQPNTTFIAFHSVRDDIRTDVPVNYVDTVVKLGEYIYNQSVAGVITNNTAQLRQMVMAEFNGIITSFTSGRMLNNGSLWMPEWIEFGINDTEQNRINIWLADESFQAQYDEYIIEIIHPVLPYDDFFKDPLVVKEILANYNIVEKLEQVQARREQYPYTYQQALQFDYVNPRDPTMRFPATWIAIIYGEAGNNPDLIKDKIVSDLLSDTTHPRSDWEAILPDLFMTTEFIFTPLWNQYSVPNSDFRAGLYSPIFDPRKRQALFRATANGPAYTPVYVDNNYEESVNIYKSLAFGVIGNPQNRNGINKFSLQFKDYIVTETNSADAQRISPLTLEWMMIFSRLIVAAETMTAYTSVPKGVARMNRNGVIYASAFFKNVNYLVVSKGSVEAIG